MTIDPAALRAVLEAAGAVVRAHYEQPPGAAVTKADMSPLTAADLASNAVLREQLLALLPEAGWLSEEDPECRPGAWTWIVDPLDGTKEFVERVPELSVSIALVHEGVARLGGIFNPITGEGGVGGPELPAHFWGCTPREVTAARLGQARASVSRTEYRKGQVEAYQPRLGTIAPVGSVAYKLLRVAAGLDDLTFSVEPKSAWDIAGGLALLAATGKVYRRFDGQPTRLDPTDPRIPCGAAAGPAPLVNAFFQ